MDFIETGVSCQSFSAFSLLQGIPDFLPLILGVEVERLMRLMAEANREAPRPS